MVYERDNPTTCEEAQVVSFLHMKDDPSLTERQREEFEAHLLVCSTCATEYEENKWLMGLLRQYCPISEDTRKLLQAAGYDAEAPEVSRASVEPYRPMTIEESWEDLKRRWPPLAEACRRDERKQQLRRVVWRIGKMAAAACIVIAIGAWFLTHKGGSGQSQSGIVANGDSPAACAELMTTEGRKPLALNEPVATDAQPQEILLGGKHRVVMNRNTKAIFTATSIEENGGPADGVVYVIQLAQGELYVEVVPGHPFTVLTANTRLDITGTQFDVLADSEKTELTLLKGSVRFSSLDHPQEAVSVTAGHASTITGRRTPTAPAMVNAAVATAWARQAIKANNTLAAAEPLVEVDLSEIRREALRWPPPEDVDTLNYEKWRDEHQRFGETFAIVAANKRSQLIKADWIELLVVSGEIWQFHYDPNLPASQPLTKLDLASIKRLAQYYRLDEHEVLKAFGFPDSVLTAATPVQDGTPGQRYAGALQCWCDAIAKAVDTQENPKANDDLKMFTFEASRYLRDTRTAAYIWVKNNPDKAHHLLADSAYVAMLSTAPDDLDKEEWVKQLRDQAAEARNCVPAAWDWLLTAPPTGCSPSPSTDQLVLHVLISALVDHGGSHSR